MTPFNAWRSAKGYTLQQAADHCGVGLTLAHKLDHGRWISLRFALRIERKTGIPHRLLVREYNEPAA